MVRVFGKEEGEVHVVRERSHGDGSREEVRGYGRVVDVLATLEVAKGLDLDIVGLEGSMGVVVGEGQECKYCEYGL